MPVLRMKSLFSGLTFASCLTSGAFAACNVTKAPYVSYNPPAE